MAVIRQQGYRTFSSPVSRTLRQAARGPPPPHPFHSQREAVPNGAVAQLGERLLCKQEVIGSIPFSSTRSRKQGSGIRDQERFARPGYVTPDTGPVAQLVRARA